MALSESLAWNACNFCQKRKRSCDRLLPSCSTCTARGIVCDYSMMKRSTPFPPGYFLDNAVFQAYQSSLPTAEVVLAGTALDAISISESVLHEYFQRIHWWMPVISKLRIYGEFRKRPNVETKLQIAAMKVLLWHPPADGDADPRTRTYNIVKNSVIEAVSAGALTLPLLQAQLLLAIYELGHAIYPTAYLTIGACSRYGLALGIDLSLQPESLSHVISQMELEEQRRTWWAIVILDRHIQLGNQRRPLSTPDPSADSVLPCDDAAFDEGVLPTSAFTVSSSPAIEMGMLARMSQAGFLLGRVYRHNQNKPTDPSDHEDEFWQLDRTIRSLLNLSYVEGEVRRMAVCGQTDLCFSALIALHDHQSLRTDEAYVDTVLSYLKPILDLMSWDSNIFINGTMVRVEDASPLLLTWPYQAARIYNRLPEEYEETLVSPMKQMKEKLKVMSRRWKAADAYLQLLELRETTRA
ncbi:hypothetical protein BDV96DRAFT_652834 [Lophiotrema nucula]|uniref:Zn(2)-C6 fungal-type domain-containing protein n=1 Tax=Lophiotrema nucula TaxID=690887 RepID=A0A6A5YNQ7_9PLEO|nr:hypothetical protein BDV96DRAFT_652834 [Lophiotrema nucula]